MSRTHKRLRLTLGGMMLLISCLAVFLAWRANKARRQGEAVAAIKAYGGFAYYDWQFADGKRTPGRSPWAPAWLRRALGDEYFQEVTHVDLVVGLTPAGVRSEVKRKTDDIIDRLTAFPELKSLRIQETQATDRAMGIIGRLEKLEDLRMIDAVVTDAGIAKLGGLKHLKSLSVDRLNGGDTQGRLTDESLYSLKDLIQLETLDLQGNRFGDRGVAQLRGMKGMKSLALSNLVHGTEITDSGLADLKGLVKLEFLGIQGSRVTDDGLEALGGMTSLKELWIKNMGRSVSEGAIKRLQARLPSLKSVR